MAKPPTERVRTILEAAAELAEPERGSFLRLACGDDSALRSEVVSLIAALEAGGDLLEPGPRRTRPREADQSLTGLRFGAYQVEERIGAGGMGVVYRATDTRLGRDVAVKALPSEFAHHPERRARLEQEARALAILNHPHIAAIYGAEDTERGAVLLLEFVPGQTIAQRLAHGPLPVDEAVSIARQIALALEAAHAVGIVHRDLKPGNVRLTPDGVAKILDFGIAEMVAPPSVASDTPTPPRAAAPADGGSGHRGWGTVAYMSPEQARGKRTDRRCDLWAFGCVLFELLSGGKAFAGETASDTLAAVLRETPDWSRLPSDTPPSLRRLLGRCLEKDPERRLRDAADARLELDDALAEWNGSPAPAAPAGPRWPLVAAVVVLAIAVLALAPLALRTPAAAPTPVRFGLRVRHHLPLEWDPGASFTVAPDGRSIAYVGFQGSENQGLFVQQLDEFEPRRLEQAGLARTPCFSPDGSSIAFCEVNTGRLRRAHVASGVVSDVGTVQCDSAGLAWLDEARIVFCNHNVLWSTPVAGDAAPTQLTALDAGLHEEFHAQPCPLPGGDVVLFAAQRYDGRERSTSIEAIHSRTGERRRILDGASAPVFLEPDLLVWCQGSQAMASRIDPRSGVLSGPPRVVLGPFAEESSGLPPPPIAAAGHLLVSLASATPAAATTLAWIDRGGELTLDWSAREPISTVRLSPDGTKAALSMGRERGAIWVREFGRGAMTRVSPSDGRNREYPVWTRDGTHLVVRSDLGDESRIELLPADASGPPSVLLTAPGTSDLAPNDTTPDGEAVLLTKRDGPTGMRELFVLPLAGGTARPLFDSPRGRSGGRFSPDGRALAYTCDETGLDQILVQPWPELDRRWQASTGEGRRVVWRPDGGAIFYRIRNELCEVPVASGPGFSVGAATVRYDRLPETRFDVARDGRVLVPCPPGDPERGTRFSILLHADVMLQRLLSEQSAAP